MTRRRNIVGLGEAVLLERPEGLAPSGLAADVAIAAARLGHAGILVTRVGQDAAGAELLELLRAAGADTTHVQSDPDLPTAREIDRGRGIRVRRYLETTAAFDNLQADFDLEDIAQQADAVVYGLLTRRSGQTRSEENRFLAACAAAVKVFDLTNRGPGVIDRGHAEAALEHADIAIVDDAALGALRPGSRGRSLAERGQELARSAAIQTVLTVEAGAAQCAIGLFGGDSAIRVAIPPGRESHATWVVAMLDGMLRSEAVDTAIQAAARAASLSAQRVGAPIPETWRKA
jgi:sugar/nucleoside kinase (ribokinase family)